MNTFVEAVINQPSRTENGMMARKNTANGAVDLFYGATRGVDIVPKFVGAYVEDRELALRVAQWIRDARGGSGERQLFKDILLHLEQHNPGDAVRLLTKVKEIGRWDDLLVVKTSALKAVAFGMIRDALHAGEKAEDILSSIDQMSEEECEALLKSLSFQSC